MTDPLKLPKLPRGRIGPSVVAGEFPPVEQQPVRHLQGGMPVVVDPDTNQVTRDRRGLDPRLHVPAPTVIDRLAEGSALRSPLGQLIEYQLLRREGGPDPSTAPRSAPLPEPVPQGAPPSDPGLANILAAVAEGSATPAQALGAAELMRYTTPVDMPQFLQALREARAMREGNR